MTIPDAGEWHAAGADNPDHVELEPEPIQQLVVEEFVEPASAFAKARPALDAVLASAKLSP